MKKLANLKDVKALTKKEQKLLTGGGFRCDNCPQWYQCYGGIARCRPHWD